MRVRLAKKIKQLLLNTLLGLGVLGVHQLGSVNLPRIWIYGVDTAETVLLEGSTLHHLTKFDI
jgi:hypothetical protein